MIRFATTMCMILSFLAVPVAAQEGPIDPGSVVLGGSVGFTSSGGELYENAQGDRLNTLRLNPTALFFVASGLALGGDLFVQRQTQGDFDSTTLAVGPAVAYLFGDSESTVYPFISGTVGYASVTTSGMDGSGLAFGGSAGAAFMLTRSVAIRASGNYRLNNMSIDQLDESYSGDAVSLLIGVEAFVF